MEDVEHGSLRTFLKANKESLAKDQELKHLFTIALYHIAQAMDHLHSKMVQAFQICIYILFKLHDILKRDAQTCYVFISSCTVTWR